mgnify:CR=1 FL=1
MSAWKFKIPALLSVGVAALVVLSMTMELFLGGRINPVALTRHAIEQCERIEDEVISGINNGSLQPDSQSAWGVVVTQLHTFREGYIKVSEGAQPVVLDAWKQPLQMTAKSNLLALTDVSPRLLAKTNTIVIWSSGPNQSNEFGHGDDIVLPLPAVNK